MFKKFKDKLAEEVKSSPQRIQQFAQAAQAAVTSASSSISDITNHDLFSIGDSDSKQNNLTEAAASLNQEFFHDVSLTRPLSSQSNTNLISGDTTPTNEAMHEAPKQRKLSNSSFASDVSFKLPYYDSPTMYHMQSDMEVSASEAEERGLQSPGMSLERVTKEQLYGAYRRTQDKYSKYRARYADLARHYKLLERENAKARSVLVETQDKALRRISELREQCNLEQSAKAHLESALRVEIDERNIKIDSLNTKIKLLQSYNGNSDATLNDSENNHEPHLIDLSGDNSKVNDGEINLPNDKIQKMEQLLVKYKESLKNSKEKNGQLTTELSVLSNDLEKRVRENVQLQAGIKQLTEARQQIQELSEQNDELQNKLDAFEFNKAKEISSLELDLKQAQDEISNLNNKIGVFSKKEEEYAISLAENKLSIHKELVEKEAEIKQSKENLIASKNEIKSLEIVLENYKQNVVKLEDENKNLHNKLNELNFTKNKLSEMENQFHELKLKCQTQEASKSKSVEEFKCLELQLKQETAEKLAMIDRNQYLETKNNQILEENSKKTKQYIDLEKSLQEFQKKYNECVSNPHNIQDTVEENNPLEADLNEWKDKYFALESEIQEERVELVKLQSEIEKLLTNHELSQAENLELNALVTKLKIENSKLHNMKLDNTNIINNCEKMQLQTRILKKNIMEISSGISKMQNKFINEITSIISNEIYKYLDDIVNNQLNQLDNEKEILYNKYKMEFDNMNKLHSIILNDINTVESEKQELEIKIRVYENEIVELERNNKILLEENELLEERCNNITDNVKELESSLNDIRNTNTELEREKEDLVLKIDEIENEQIRKREDVENVSIKSILELQKTIDTLTKDVKNSSSEINTLQDRLRQNENEVNKKETELTSCKLSLDKYMSTLNEVNKENKLLHEKCERLKQEKEEFHEKTLNVEKTLLEHERKFEAQQKLLIDLDTNNSKINQLENDLQCVKHENDRLNEINKDLSLKLSDLTFDKNNVMDKLNISRDELKLHVERLKNENKVLESKCTDFNNETEVLKEQLERLLVDTNREKNIMENIIHGLKNDLLSQSENMTKLQACIEHANENNSQITNKMAELEHDKIGYIEENKNLQAENIQKVSELTEIELKHSGLLHECEIIKENNKRLISDIEGLQTHLIKVSKDNSNLNDKLRDVIANSENSFLNSNNKQSSDSSDETNEIINLKSECQKQLEKIEDLQRQNSILAEENLELQDQLKLQSASNENLSFEKSVTEKELEFVRLKDKHDSILDEKSQLEKKLSDLEYINSSGDKNMQHLEEKNEKLKLSHEKLERRLDEALVSLRHLRALEENTELEYLRNILYEYLTGSGTHSVTLAKVLSAVVKFDDRQTQMVLQREKERQGLLRQLGLL